MKERFLEMGIGGALIGLFGIDDDPPGPGMKGLVPAMDRKGLDPGAQARRQLAERNGEAVGQSPSGGGIEFGVHGDLDLRAVGKAGEEEMRLDHRLAIHPLVPDLPGRLTEGFEAEEGGRVGGGDDVEDRPGGVAEGRVGPTLRDGLRGEKADEDQGTDCPVAVFFGGGSCGPSPLIAAVARHGRSLPWPPTRGKRAAPLRR